MNEINLFAQFVELKQICKTWGRGKDVQNIWEAPTEEVKDIVVVKRNLYDLLRAVVALNPIELALRLYNALQSLFGLDQKRHAVIGLVFSCADTAKFEDIYANLDVAGLRRFGLLTLHAISRVRLFIQWLKWNNIEFISLLNLFLFPCRLIKPLKSTKQFYLNFKHLDFLWSNHLRRKFD